VKQQTSSASTYPNLEAAEEFSSSAPRLPDALQFRLQKIGELQTFLCSEIECRGRLHKKYRRAVNAVDGTCAALGTTCIVSGTVSAGLLVSGIGFVAGITLEVVIGVAGLLDIAVSLFHALLHQSRQAEGCSSPHRSSIQFTATFQKHWRTVRFPMTSIS